MLLNLNTIEYKDYYDNLKRCHFECDGYEHLLSYLIQNNAKDTDYFKSYFNEYVEHLIIYEKAKEKFTEILLNNGNTFTKWNIIFEKDMVQLD